MTVANPKYADMRFNADTNHWESVKEILGNESVTLGPVASHSWLHQPEHLGFQIARYRAAAALIGNAQRVLEIGSGEGIGARILAKGRSYYCGIDSDAEAVQYARASVRGTDQTQIEFLDEDILAFPGLFNHDAVVSLDTIEHIPAEREGDFMRAAITGMKSYGVMVVGTPNLTAAAYASPQSQVGHINLYSHDRLKALMARYFRVVQMMGSQDTSVHFGLGSMSHYLIGVGISPRQAV
jgi:2-polyprenyl-3-methyl-5-hydroxy-6-metoxy-1,4-benzoquinol methylase